MKDPKTLRNLTQGHIFERFDGELTHLHDVVLSMGGLVLQQLSDALTAFQSQDLHLANQVRSRDLDIDRMEVAADEEILELIARRCPLGPDLRVVITVSKSVSDLEKIGDEAVRIVSLMDQIARDAEGSIPQPVKSEMERLGSMALKSFQNAVELFDAWDEAKAFRVIDSHREMDGEFQSELRRLIDYIMTDTINIGMAVGMVLVAKSLERITHHAQNLAEYALFEVKGVDIRVKQP
jgi:phosphate transport system protein